MSKSVLLKSSIAKKYWMALTGLFLCTFLVGHLAGNLQLVFSTGEEGKRAFNEYAYFMAHNPAIKLLSYVTYISILFHIVDGFMLTIQNKKARPVGYAYNKPSANSSMASRNMAVLGTLILVFLATHMANFWWKAKVSSEKFPLHTYIVYPPMAERPTEMYYTIKGDPIPKEGVIVKEGTKLFIDSKMLEQQIADMKQMNPGQQLPDMSQMNKNPELGEGYKDLHSLVFAFFGHDKTKQGFPINEMALAGLIFYVISMLVLGFHLWHGFSSAFQSLGVNHPTYTSWIKKLGYGFAILVPGLFALIPIVIFITK
jgi:succinate dehydrogenase / fumarate reductase cytochrome b subunit